MPLNVINQGLFHAAKAVWHFCGLWLPAQWQALASPPLPGGFKVTFRAFQTQGSFHRATCSCLFCQRTCFSLNRRVLVKMLNFVNPLSFLGEMDLGSEVILYQNFLVLYKVMTFQDTKVIPCLISICACLQCFAFLNFCLFTNLFISLGIVWGDI